MKKFTLIAASVMSVAVLVSPLAASAANPIISAVYTVKPNKPVPSTVFTTSLADINGVVKGTLFTNVSTPVSTVTPNYWTFSIDSSFSNGAKTSFALNALVSGVKASTFNFQVYKGAVLGAGQLVYDDVAALNQSVVLGTGDYYIEMVNGSVNNIKYQDVQASGEQVTGIVQMSAAPEPAAWSLMILGIGGIGGVLRTRRRAVTA